MSQPNHENCEKQHHVHELLGSTAVVSECSECSKESECHNHRFATVTGEAIGPKEHHYHEVKFHTDTADGHYHEFCGKTCPAVDVGNGKHVHYIKAMTEQEDGHRHKFQAATLIESPIDFECRK